MHCGWLPRAEWRDGKHHLPVALGPHRYTSDLCPGYLVRQPEVLEAGEAYEALEAGILDRHDPRGTRAVTIAALLMRRAMQQLEADRTMRAAQRAKASRG